MSFPSVLFLTVVAGTATLNFNNGRRQRGSDDLQQPVFSWLVGNSLNIADSSTLEAFVCGIVCDKPWGTLVGKMATVVDLVTRLPVHFWFEEKPSASDTHFEAGLFRRLF